MKEYRFVGSHADELDGGRPIAPGDFTGPINIVDDESKEDYTPKAAQLLADGHLIEVADGSADTAAKAAAADEPPVPDEDGVLRGDDLQKRAEELDIKGRSTMSADKLRQAVATAESEAIGENLGG